MIDQASTLRKLINQQDAEPAAPKQSPCEIIAVTSGKGGVGKSNVTLNTAAALAQNGSSVLILDADIGTANIDILLGKDPRQNLAHVIEGEASLYDVIEKVNEKLYFIPGASGIADIGSMPTSNLERFRDDIFKLESLFDYLLVDTSAGVSDNVIKMLCASDRVLLICNGEPTSIVDAYALCKLLFQQYPDVNIYLVANNVKDEQEAQEVYDKLNAAVTHFLKKELHFLSHVVHDKAITAAVASQEPVMLADADVPAKANFVELANLLKHPEGWRQGKGFSELFNSLIKD